MLGGPTAPQTEQSDLQLVDHQLADQVGIDFVERGIATGTRASQRTVVSVRRTILNDRQRHVQNGSRNISVYEDASSCEQSKAKARWARSCGEPDRYLGQPAHTSGGRRRGHRNWHERLHTGIAC
jgi:hypothetical protein